MRRKWCSRIAFTLCGVVVVGAPAYGDVVLEEHNGHYYNPSDPNDPNNTYELTWDGSVPRIKILKPSGDLAYDFECRDTSTGREATIGAIVGGDSLEGLVELMVRGHSGRSFGALNVSRLQLDPNDVDGRVKEFTISGQLGSYDPNDPNTAYARSIAGPVSVSGLAGSLDVRTIAESGSLTLPTLSNSIHVGGAVEGAVTISRVQAPIDVDGTLAGRIEVEDLVADLNPLPALLR